MKSTRAFCWFWLATLPASFVSGACGSNAEPAPLSATREEGTRPPDPPDPSCKASPTPDVPDDEFKDANCDGIDGDRTRAVFVAPAGDDAADGSVERPVKTITKAVELAGAAQKNVYLCNGTYRENVVLKSVAVSLYGGYDCANGWKRVNDRARIHPAKGVALTVRDVANTVRIERVALKASDALEPGGSSIALFVANTPNLTVDNAQIDAGRAADGETPPPPAAITARALAGANGTSRELKSCYTGATNKPPACTTPTVVGGATTQVPTACEGLGGVGGVGGNVFANANSGPGADGGPASVGGKGPGPNGNAGQPGTPGASGENAKSGLGLVTADGYTAANRGGDGTPGSAGGGGQGGAGGISTYRGDLQAEYFAAGGGGQGGFGGCGGSAAKGSGAGGGSIAVVLYNAPVRFTRSHLSTSEGGRGGNSVAGADGQPGGEPGRGGSGTSAGASGFAGGAGGRGGRGGSGGAGGGGPSIGVLVSGTPPILTSVVFNLAAGGKGGSGQPDAPDGVVGEVVSADSQ